MYKNLKFTTLSKAYKEVGISYLGDVNHSTKLKHGEKLNLDTYGVYLAPSNMSGFKACTHDKHCREHCLFFSGRNMVEGLSDRTVISDSRIKKTRLFFTNKNYYMQVLIAEIAKKRNEAKVNNHEFAIRLNCTSDIPLESFVYQNKNILQIYKDIQFYDYTKNPANLKLVEKYKNFHLTFSFDGHNWSACKKALDMGVNVAVVFDTKNFPKTFNGYEVINGDDTDYRPFDKKGTIVGLKFKTTSTAIINHKFIMPETPFVVKGTDKRCTYSTEYVEVKKVKRSRKEQLKLQVA
jgi:hypothetical protein